MIPFSSYPCQNLLLPIVFIMLIKVCVKWYFILVLIYISLITNDIKQFHYLLAIFISSFGKCHFRIFAHVSTGFFPFFAHVSIGFFPLLSCNSSLNIQKISPYQIYSLQTIQGGNGSLLHPAGSFVWPRDSLVVEHELSSCSVAPQHMGSQFLDQR